MSTHRDWKPIQLPPLAEWKGIAYYSVNPNGAILITTDQTKTLQVDLSPLRPGEVHRLKANLKVDATTGNTPEIRFSEASQTLTSGETTQVTLDSTLPIEPILTITGAENITINSLELSILFPDRSKPLPYDLLGFDMLMANTPPGFIIGKDRIGHAPLGGGSAIAGAFIIGQSRLDIDRLPIPLPEYSWRDILAPGLSLSFRQGANQGSTLLPVAQVGTATIEIKDFDPREAFLKRGLKCRIYHRLTRETIYTGTLSRFTMKPAKYKTQHDIATLEFVDTVGQLAATTRYGVRTETPETLKQRVERLLKDTGIAWEILNTKPAVPDALGATTSEANLASYLDMTTASIGGAWWVDHEGKVIVNPNTDVQVFHKVPWFVIGKTPLDAGKLPPEGVEKLTTPEQEQAITANPFIIGQSRLDQAYVAAATLAEGVTQGFIIGQSRLDYAILTEPPVNTLWAVKPPSEPPLLTDRYTDEARAIYYTDLEPGFNSAEMLGEIAVENHTASKENGSWSDHTKTAVAKSPNATMMYGANRKTIRTTCATSEQAQALAEYLLNRPIIADRSAFAITSVKLNALPISTRAALTLFSYCQIRFRDARSDHLVYATEHRLTPYTWSERLYLTEAREERIEIP